RYPPHIHSVPTRRSSDLNANLDEYVIIREKNFFDTQKESRGPLHMLFNPPYGERLDIHMEEFYASIGDTLKKGYPNTHAWFITADRKSTRLNSSHVKISY